MSNVKQDARGGPPCANGAAAQEIVAALAQVLRSSSAMACASRSWIHALGALREALDRHGWGFAYGALVADGHGNPFSMADGDGGWPEEAERRLRAIGFDPEAGDRSK